MSTPEPRIVHEDEALAVIDKPAGLVVHPAPSHSGPTLVDELGDLLGGGADPERPGIVHRLDKDTSGLLVVARTEEAHRALQEAVRERRVERVYLALADGRISARAPGRSTRRSGGPRGSGTGWPSPAPPRARRAPTSRSSSCFPPTATSRRRLETGRTHQIRAHFAAIGHPLVGDATYGGPARYGLERQFLHAHRLAFDHPLSGERLEFRSELPEDLASALDAARAA